MSDRWQRYLAQQIELGGAEVVLGWRKERADAAPTQDPPSLSEGEDVTPRRKVAPEADTSTPRRAKDTSADLAAAPWMKGAPPIPGPGMTVEPTVVKRAESLARALQRLETLDEVAERIRTTECSGLCATRTHAVPGEGNPRADFMLVGEGPGATEDATGRPFVGQAGQLLDGILQAIGLPREAVFIANVVKCRPPGNRKPEPDEVAACIPYLHRQIELVGPKVLLALGGTAAEALLGVKKSLGELRGKVHRFNGIPLIVTYHPAALLRNPTWKKPTWDDVRIARQLLDR